MNPPLTELASYGGLHRARCRRFVPSDLAELRALFARARAEGRSVTLRGGGLAFDSQSLNDDWVISLERFGGIWVDAPAAQVIVGPAARWGDIVRESLRHDLLFPIVPTASDATAGGTIAANGIGRFSRLYGKEADWIERFTLLTADGALLECSRSSDAPLFRAVIGGHGYLGAVVRATYRLLPIGGARWVRHRLRKERSFESMAVRLLARSGAQPGETVTSLVIPDGREQALVFYASLVAKGGGHRVPGLAPGHFTRTPLEWAMRSSKLSSAVWNLAFRWLFREDVDYHDRLVDFLFFMDGNVRAKALGMRLGLPMCSVQQSFAIPVPLEGSAASRTAALVAFLRSVNELLARHRVASVFFDVLVIPREEDSVLSSSPDFDAFMVSVAFEESAPPVVARVRACLEGLSRRCLEIGGRVHLSKNVYASPEVLEAMYAPALDTFFEQKRRTDAAGILCNGFLERLFPRRVAAWRGFLRDQL